jgi:leader peptidase (prepilin peptidase) / N-methyltransferase
MNFSIILPLVLGWAAGWLVNYLADVLPLTRRLSQPICAQCKKKMTWRDTLSFHACPACGHKPSKRRWVVQLALTVAAILIWFFPNPHLGFLLSLILLIYLTLVFVIDMEHRLILHPVSLVGAVLGLVFGLILNSSGTSFKIGALNTLLGGAFGFGVMLVFYYIGGAYVRYMSKKRGLPADEVALGFGDVNLSGILGLLLGWPTIILGLFFAILAGGLVSLVLVLKMVLSKKYQAFTAIPYAPFLIAGAIIFLFL